MKHETFEFVRAWIEQHTEKANATTPARDLWLPFQQHAHTERFYVVRRGFSNALIRMGYRLRKSNGRVLVDGLRLLDDGHVVCPCCGGTGYSVVGTPSE